MDPATVDPGGQYLSFVVRAQLPPSAPALGLECPGNRQRRALAQAYSLHSKRHALVPTGLSVLRVTRLERLGEQHAHRQSKTR